MTSQQHLPTGDDLQVLLQTPIRQPLPENVVKEILLSPPFIPVPMALNLRTICSPTLAPNILYRSGALSHLPPATLSLLKSHHNITTIFDLRSRNEREKSPSPDIEGIETIWIPSTKDIDSGVMVAGSVEGSSKLLLSDLNPSDFVANEGVDGYIAMYNNILQTHKNAYRTFFEKLRDGDGAILFHCTAGKDRTGVLAALIHALLDSPDEIIANDYGLTRIGVEPFRDHLLKALLQQMGRKDEQFGRDFDVPGMEEICGVRGPTILAFLKSMEKKYRTDEKVRSKYSGARGYLTEELGLSGGDLEKIRKRLGNIKV